MLHGLDSLHIGCSLMRVDSMSVFSTTYCVEQALPAALCYHSLPPLHVTSWLCRWLSDSTTSLHRQHPCFNSFVGSMVVDIRWTAGTPSRRNGNDGPADAALRLYIRFLRVMILVTAALISGFISVRACSGLVPWWSFKNGNGDRACAVRKECTAEHMSDCPYDIRTSSCIQICASASSAVRRFVIS